MGSYLNEVAWLKDEIARMKGRMTQLNAQQRDWGAALARQRQRNVTLTEQLAQADKELAAAQEEKRKEAARQQKAQEKAANDEAEKKKELGMACLEHERLSKKLEETQRQVAPFLEEINALKTEIDPLRQSIEAKQTTLAASELLPNEVKSYQARLERAMALKPGLLQKARFADELLAELGESGNSERSRLLVEYKRLAKSLQTMEYEQPGE